MKPTAAKSKPKTSAAANGKKRARRAHESRARYSVNAESVVEMYGGEPYAYYALGKYVVVAPGVCGGRPTFKYTRIEAAFILDLLAGGWTIRRVINFYKRPEISEPAIREALRLASAAFVNTYPALPMAI